LDGRPGTRAPHLWLIGKDGSTFSTLDKFGKKFVLLAGKNGHQWRTAASEVINKTKTNKNNKQNKQNKKNVCLTQKQ
jgi:hypothetical protein